MDDSSATFLVETIRFKRIRGVYAKIEKITFMNKILCLIQIDHDFKKLLSRKNQIFEFVLNRVKVKDVIFHAK